MVVFCQNIKIWYYNDARLECFSSYKYLRVVFSKTLSWNKHMLSASVQAKKILYGILKSLSKFKPLSYDIYFKVFDSKVSPILLYGSEVWGFDNVSIVEAVHLAACKRFLGVKTSTPNSVVYGECGRYPLYISMYKRIIKYWIRILNLQDSRYVKLSYNMLLQLAMHGKMNWVYKVKQLLCSNGFGFIWEQQRIDNVPAFISEFTLRLKLSFEQEWHNSLATSTKTNTYSLFKLSVCYEPYLKSITIAKFRVALARFRCGSHCLRIETGRYHNEPVELRTCNICKLPYIEDEYHFMFICNHYCDLRKTYLPEKYYTYPTKHKYCIMMTSVNERLCKNIAMFIYYGMSRRSITVSNS